MLMNEAIPRVVALADAALHKKDGKGILDKYGPNRPRKQIMFFGVQIAKTQIKERILRSRTT